MSGKGLSEEDEKFQGTGHAATELVIRGRVESVFYPSHLGGFAGRGAEKTPAGDYSINTPSRVRFEDGL
jgi:hypothetical protein